MILMAQSVPSATSVPCVAALPTGWSLGDVHIARDRSTFSLDSDRGGTDAVEATLLPRDECEIAGATRCRATRSAVRRFERIRRLPPRLRDHPHLPVRGRVRHLPVRLRRLDGPVSSTLLFDADAHSPSSPGPSWSRGPRPERSAPVRRRRAGVPGRIDMIVVLRVVVGRRRRRGHDDACRCGCSGCAGAGASASSRGSSAGASGSCSPWASPTGTGAPTASSCTRSRSASRPRWRVAVALDLLARPGSLAIGERAGLVVAPAPAPGRAATDRGVPPLPRAAAPRPARRVRAVLAGRARDRRPGRRRSASACAACSRRPAASTSSSARSPRRASTSCPPEICEELAELQNRVAPEAGRAHAARPRGRARRRPSTTVFAEFDWEPLAAASIGQTYRAVLRTGEAVVVKVQRPGVDEVIERDLAALSLLADARPAAHPARPGRPLRRAARPVRGQPPGRARLPARGRRHGRDDRAARPGLAGAGAAGLPRALHPPAPRAGALRRVHGGRRRARWPCPGSTATASPSGSSRCFLEQVLRIGFFHADPHPGNIFVFADGTLGLIDFGAVGRLDPIQQAAVVDMLVALVRRDVGLLRDGIERVADVSETVSPRAARTGAGPADGRERARQRAASTRPCCRTSSRCWREFGIRLPADLVVLSRCARDPRRHAAGDLARRLAGRGGGRADDARPTAGHRSDRR